MKNKLQVEVYIPVRVVKEDGQEFFDIAGYGYSKEDVQKKAKLMEKKTPKTAAAYPICRIVKQTLRG